MAPIGDILNRLEEAERRFAGRRFLAPLLGRNRVEVRLAGVVCRLKVTEVLPAGFTGWAVLEARSTGEAQFVRPAGLAETAAYLALFPALRLVLAGRLKWKGPSGRAPWLAFPAQRGDRRFRIEGGVPLLLPEAGLERFETVVSRFDGRSFWYERREPGRDPAISAYLRSRLAQAGEEELPPAPEALHKRGLSAEERAAYAWARSLVEAAQRSREEQRLAGALEHAGGRLTSYSERGETTTVTYEVDGQPHVSILRSADLTVLSAGICLSEQDERFDLASLVGVLREAGSGGRLRWQE